ncbi:hypothetical protein [Paenibacillus senegalimassiliensis]|uniref:hypothetical protein n=1 Tax=Paenibacillus senegalimassiliensis TaxID=1737426 RepID=UPI00073E4D53|nr:hypothetical protein [Paenibacillus senegalimassiliensis]
MDMDVINKPTKPLLLAAATLAVVVIAGCSWKDSSKPPSGAISEHPEQETSVEQSANTLNEPFTNGLTFLTERNDHGDLVAVPLGLAKDQYSIISGPAIELQGTTYLNVHLFYGDHNAMNALIAHDPTTETVQTLWSETLNGSDNRWNNAFMDSYRLLLPLDSHRLLFLEPDLTEEGGQYHLSAYDVRTGHVERLRSDFWPLGDEYDYIYNFNWNADKQQLFMQSYLGNVWFFDLQDGDDQVHSWKYRVIPHSTTGMPSLFLSPTFKRFVFDDESGKLSVYNKQGVLLNTIALPVDHYVPSEKMKWNPAGTIAWMEEAEVENYRVLGIDIDFLQIAPQQVNFYDQDGHPLGFIQAEQGKKNSAIEVVGWIDDNVAVIKAYSVVAGALGGSTPKVEDEAYYLYDVASKKKGATTATVPEGTIGVAGSQTFPVEDERPVTVTHDEIIFKKK